MSERERADPPERRFYSRPSLRSALFSLFFLPIAAVLGVETLRDPQGGTLPPFLGTLLLLIASLWLVWRRSLPWQGPALVATSEGLHIWPERRGAVFMPWSDLKGVGMDPSDHSLIFHPKRPGAYERPYLIWLRRPPFLPDDIRTRDGEHFLNVLEEYLPED